MAEEALEVTRETMETLAVKLDTFGESLSDDELAVLGAVLSAGMEAVASEVEGFAASPETGSSTVPHMDISLRAELLPLGALFNPKELTLDKKVSWPK